MVLEAVKKETFEDPDFHETPPFAHPDSTSLLPTEDHVTVARLSLSPSPLSVKLKHPTEKPIRRLKIKKRSSDSKKIKHEGSSHARNSICYKQNNAETVGLSSPGEFKSSAMIRAEEVQSNLESAFPSFVKALVRSHVGSCFWMGLPGGFCRAYLPYVDMTVSLEDEYGKGYRMKYIAHKTGLSAGWRQFAVAQQLVEGDVLVFQLIGPCRFKVYVIRANDLTELDGALGLLNLDTQIKQNFAVRENTDMPNVTYEGRKRKQPRSLSLVKKNKKSGRSRSAISNNGHPTEQSENDSEEVASEVLEGFKSLPDLEFKDIKSFENFNILVDGLVLDSEITEDIRSKYYKLCRSQNAFLHENLIKGVNFKLIAGLITEAVNIADSLRACDLTTSREEFVMWDKSLKASELFGMSVGFLRARLSHLVQLAVDSEGAAETRRFIEARAERAHTEEEIRDLETKLAELKAAYERYGTDISNQKWKVEDYEQRFQEEVLAPW